MNHNFANWEITQLLPEKNPRFNETCVYWFGKCNNSTIAKIPTEQLLEIRLKLPILSYNSFRTTPKFIWRPLRHAWTFEDIRLYLLSKGYIVDIIYVMDREGEQLQWYFKVLTISTYETDEDFTYYSSYEECREAAILFTLNELK